MIIFSSMKPYQAIKIIECNEPLVTIPPTEFILEEPCAYAKCGADYQGKSAYFLREGVLTKLLQAKAQLAQIKPDWQLKIFDAYRPISVQRHMVDYTFKSLCHDRQLNPHQLSNEQKDTLYQEVYQIWAVPSDNPQTPPPHSTGAAIDLTLMTQQKIEINLGGEIDELSPRSHPDYYAEATTTIEKQYHHDRLLLNQIMTQAGFRRHPQEWWHFSYGDQFYSWLANQTTAKYGRIIQ